MVLNIDLMGLRALEAKPRGDRLLEAALKYAASGNRVVPLAANSKIPAIKDWPAKASCDPAVIRQWFGTSGEHWNSNVAILINGFTVIDVDRHGDVDGFKTLAGSLDGVPCPRAITPNDGEHLLASITDVKDAAGVEILGDGKLFTVYPSEIDGKRYVWKMGGSPSPVKRIREAPTARAVAGAVALAPAGYLKSVLEHIDPDSDYSNWLKVGMALHHNDAGEGGLKVWVEWSQNGRKYKEGECERRWATFDANRGKASTVRWLIIEAVKNGRVITKEDIIYHGNLYNGIEIDKVNEKYGVYDLGGKIYVVYREKGQVHFADPANFRVKIANWKAEVDGKLKPMSDVWLEHPDRRVISEVGMWEIGKEPEGALNYFTGLAVQPVPCTEDDIRLFLDFCLYDICRGNEKYYGFLMDMLASKLQKPLHLIKLCLVLRGGEGVGKGALTRVMENLIGPEHSVNVSSSNSWLGQFGTLLKGAIWLSANEAHWSGNHSQGERLKALVSEETIDIEEKYINARKHKNRLMVGITTNNSWAVPAGHDSRRYFVLDVSDNRANDPKFWDEFHALMGCNKDTHELNNPEYMGRVLWWFQNRKITHDLKRAMETEWLVEQRKETAVESREEMFVQWVRLTFCGDLPNDLVTGPGGFSFVRVERADGTQCIRSDRVYDDYRAFVSKNTRKPRMTLAAGSFLENLRGIGFASTRVFKDRLKMNGHKLPDSMGNGAKIVVMTLPPADEIEVGISKNFNLFSDGVVDEE